jgi:hypothetical protein
VTALLPMRKPLMKYDAPVVGPAGVIREGHHRTNAD